jgi:hypothetical protein
VACASWRRSAAASIARSERNRSIHRRATASSRDSAREAQLLIKVPPAVEPLQHGKQRVDLVVDGAHVDAARRDPYPQLVRPLDLGADVIELPS